MSSVPQPLRSAPPNDYPTSDGKPMAETDRHRIEAVETIETLEDRYADRPDAYISGNILLFYVEGDRRRHVSPDVLVVLGIPKHERDNYLVWSEGKGPDVIIEFTSKTTRKEDQQKKKLIYEKTLRVPEYFLFDPTEDYLDPPLQGYRRLRGRYQPIPKLDGRLPSAQLELHLERVGQQLRLYDPATGRRLVRRREEIAERRAAAQAERTRAERAETLALEERTRAEQEKARADALAEQLRQLQARLEAGPAPKGRKRSNDR